MYTETQNILDSQSNPEKKNKAGGIPDFTQLYHRALAIKTVWCCNKN